MSSFFVFSQLLVSVCTLVLIGDFRVTALTTSHTLVSDQRVTYRYLLHKPTNLARPEGVPLIVFLHGCMQTAQDFELGVHADYLAQEFQTVLLFPEQSIEENEMLCWNWFAPQNQVRGQGEPKIIVDMISQVIKDTQEQIKIDKSRIYVAGFSAGAALANTLGAVYPDVFAAIASHSGVPYRCAQDAPSALTVQTHGHKEPLVLGQNIFNTHQQLFNGNAYVMPVIVLHGREDLLNSRSNSDEIVKTWLLHNYLVLQPNQDYDDDLEDYEEDQFVIDTDLIFKTFKPSMRRPQILLKGRSEKGKGYYSFKRFYDLSSDYRVLVEQWNIAALGHAWSGGSNSGSFTNSSSISATTLIFEFFLRHKRSTI